METATLRTICWTTKRWRNYMQFAQKPLTGVSLLSHIWLIFLKLNDVIFFRSETYVNFMGDLKISDRKTHWKIMDNQSTETGVLTDVLLEDLNLHHYTPKTTVLASSKPCNHHHHGPYQYNQWSVQSVLPLGTCFPMQNIFKQLLGKPSRFNLIPAH